MTQAEQLAAFVLRSSYTNLSEAARDQLKVRLLDSLGCAIAALEGEPIRLIRSQLEDFGALQESGRCTLIGGGKTAPDRAAFYNTALVRYVDFMDSYLVKGETCHPSDNIGSVLAACEYANRSGKDLLEAIAVAYQVECRLTDEAPVMRKGFDHTTQLSFSIAAGISKALQLDASKTANAVAICGADFTTLAVVRASPASQWKGLDSAAKAFGSTHGSFLAMRGVTGPIEVFEGPKGFMETLDVKLAIDWSAENLERVTQTVVKRYNAEVHSQSALEGVLELQQAHAFQAREVSRVDVEIFHTAFAIIGGGEFGDRKDVRIKEQADHSLPYLIAVAILDGDVMPEQFRPERISRPDVQELLRRVEVGTVIPLEKPKALVERLDPYTRGYPNEMPCHITVLLRDGRKLEIEKRDYNGFHTRPLSWAQVVEKFDRLSMPFADQVLRREITQAVADLESIMVADLMMLLARVGVE